jgi:hypothetical protein
MDMARDFKSDNSHVSRRSILEAAAAGALALGGSQIVGNAMASDKPFREAVSGLGYLTPPERFRTLNREKPRIDQLAAGKLREVGLDRETWQLEVIADPASNSKIDRPLSRSDGTALSWQGLMQLAERHAVRFLKVLSCTNMDEPLGMGLWEGVPLRHVIWMCKPRANVRRAYYHGFHNNEEKQLFRSSLAIDRILEDAPGEMPVILCYKLNGQWLAVGNGGPVRMIVPEAYGNRCVKWLQRIILTNDFKANDTYAEWNNNVESVMKSFARFIKRPVNIKAGEQQFVVGQAEVGVGGLSKVQVSLHPQEVPLPADDPYLDRLEWRDATLLAPPADWGGGLPEGKLPSVPLQFDAAGKPLTWPLRYTIAEWMAILPALRPGKYDLRCRAVDGNGIAQPLPRPLPRSGNNAIQRVTINVEA